MNDNEGSNAEVPESQLEQQPTGELEKAALDRKRLQPMKVTPKPQIRPDSAEVKDFLKIERENLVQAVIWAEILGKPRAKRGRR